MDWVKEILSVLATLVAISGLLSVPKLFSDLSFIRKIDYDEWEKFKQREKEFDENIQLFEKEMLLRTVGFLRYLNWCEYNFIKGLDLNIDLIKILNLLKGHYKLRFDGQKLCIHCGFFDNYKNGDKFKNLAMILYFIFFVRQMLIDGNIFYDSFYNVTLPFILAFVAIYDIARMLYGVYLSNFIKKIIIKDNELKENFKFE